VAYLLYLSWLTFADRGELTVEQEQPVRSAPRVIASGVAVNLLNPKLTIFFFAFLPQFVRADQTRPALQMLELSGVFMLVTFVVFAGYGVLAASFRERVRSRPRSVIWLRRAFAGSYAALACRLALTQR
jgi:threonine/homoserine/homoserine lactone efflux protein